MAQHMSKCCWQGAAVDQFSSGVNTNFPSFRKCVKKRGLFRDAIFPWSPQVPQVPKPTQRGVSLSAASGLSLCVLEFPGAGPPMLNFLSSCDCRKKSRRSDLQTSSTLFSPPPLRRLRTRSRLPWFPTRSGRNPQLLPTLLSDATLSCFTRSILCLCRPKPPAQRSGGSRSYQFALLSLVSALIVLTWREPRYRRARSTLSIEEEQEEEEKEEKEEETERGRRRREEED
ncbi:hypothetical protein I7I51_00128 [Histoplasma capsulatum]|uniref:Uncharacterized protein n=1 Tax=Ajellomyces capsulatus TaxID=5037 RepID=A0A8A1MAQ9_AJECA|nr:hypothetical protein I7I51_00128 [Histoplasma capsulatum]